jgi:integrase
VSTGIVVRHSRTCGAPKAKCSCRPSYRAEIYDRRSGKKIRRTFRNLSEAKGWRHDAASELRKGTLSTSTKTTLREAGDAWLEGAKSGAIRTRSGHVYKPSTIRGYESALKERIYPELGACRLSEVRRVDVQDFADRLLADGLDASTIRNVLMPLRAIYRRAISRGVLSVNPTTGLELPSVQGSRDRIASPEEAAALIAALAERDQALWATAFYAGLRAGEIQGLRWEDVGKDKIRVERAYDPKAAQFVEPKSKAGRRSVPLPAVLRGFLLEHQMRQGRRDGLVFGRDAEHPFTASNVWRRARTAWKSMNAERVKLGLEPLEPIGLHEARHTFASLMIAAGVNAKSLSTYMGHSSITITYDRYGHLMPGNEDEAADLLDAYLERAAAGQKWASEGQ